MTDLCPASWCPWSRSCWRGPSPGTPSPWWRSRSGWSYPSPGLLHTHQKIISTSITWQRGCKYPGRILLEHSEVWSVWWFSLRLQHPERRRRFVRVRVRLKQMWNVSALSCLLLCDFSDLLFPLEWRALPFSDDGRDVLVFSNNVSAGVSWTSKII